jgi:hypothetical protein
MSIAMMLGVVFLVFVGAGVALVGMSDLPRSSRRMFSATETSGVSPTTGRAPAPLAYLDAA